MAYGRRVIQDLDERYENAIERMYQPDPMTDAGTIRGVMALLGGASPSFKRVTAEPSRQIEVRDEASRTSSYREATDQEYARLVSDANKADVLIRAYSMLPKYGAPIAGVTAAGMALQDLTDRFTAQSADEPKETTVRMPY